MANAIPLLEGTAASGGYLVPDNFNGLMFERGLNRQSAVVGMPGLRVRRVSGKREKFTEYVGRPTVATVAEAANKPVTGAEYAEVTCDIVKAATVVMYTEELIEDAQEDPTILINADVRAAFADYIDSNALGRTSAGAITGAFNSELAETTQTVELGATADRVAVAVSAAMGTIEGNGYTPTGVILAHDARQHFRDARQATETTAQVYADVAGGFVQPTPTLFGLNIGYTTNLQTLAGTAGAGRIVGVVGDFTHAMLAVRNDIRIKFSDQATVETSGPTYHHLWQQNKVASLWEMRLGFVAHDLNRAFVAILNAT
jgi:HK97 family phage major capsid protein